MIAEALKQVQAQAAEQLGVARVPMSRQPADRPYVRVGQELKRYELDPPPRNIVVGDLRALTDMARAHFDERTVENNRMAVFISDDAVTLIFDTRDGRERAVYPLEATPEYAWLKKQHDSQPTVSQEDFRKAARTFLRECWPEPERVKLVTQLSQMTWTAGAEQQQIISRDSNFVGVKKSQEINTPTALPDELQILLVRRWRNRDIDSRARMTCFFDPDHARKQFVFHPLPNSLDEYHAEVVDIQKTIVANMIGGEEEGKVPIYLGTFPENNPGLQSA